MALNDSHPVAYDTKTTQTTLRARAKAPRQSLRNIDAVFHQDLMTAA